MCIDGSNVLLILAMKVISSVSRYFVGPVMVAQASKHIRAGEEVTDKCTWPKQT